MPGIVGLVTRRPAEWASSELARMVRGMSSESFYAFGTWCHEPLGVYVGWVARKGSMSDGMPLSNVTGDITLVFSGEEFPDSELASRHRPTTTGGVLSYLVGCYEGDSAFPASLNGRFHGLVADNRRGVATLFNDRYGMHRLYYHEGQDAFYFSAEAKAILAVRPELRTPDVRGLGELVSCGCALENRTIFKGVSVLPIGSSWVFRGGALEEKGTYFRPSEWENQEPLESERYYEELRDVFSRNLPRYFDGPERVGMSLTGGVDTRMILAWHRPAPGTLPCYTFGSIYRDPHDVRLGREIARACGQSHEVIRADEQFLNRFPHYAERTVYVTDGCTDVSRAPVLYANEHARHIAPVRMTGNYGGEVLRGLRAFKPGQPPHGLFQPELLSSVEAARETYRALIGKRAVSFSVFKQAPWHHYGLLALEQSQLSLRSPYLDNDFVRTVFRSPTSVDKSKDVSLRLIADGNPALMGIRTDRGHHPGRSGPLAAKIARQVFEFSFKAEYAYNYGMPQWLARTDHVLERLHLERLFLGRHKYYHFRVWYRDQLAAYVKEMLLDTRALSRPYVDRKGLEAVVRGHVRGVRNYTTELHTLLTLELIHRLFMDAT